MLHLLGKLLRLGLKLATCLAVFFVSMVLLAMALQNGLGWGLALVLLYLAAYALASWQQWPRLQSGLLVGWFGLFCGAMFFWDKYGGGGQPAPRQAVHLVFHVGDQGRDDNGDAGKVEGGQLVDEGFARACRHDDQQVAPLQETLEGVVLAGAEGREAKVAAQRGEERVGHGRRAWIKHHLLPPTWGRQEA